LGESEKKMAPAAAKRLLKEYKMLQKEPVPYIYAKPLETQLLHWHFVIDAPEETDYQGMHGHKNISPLHTHAYAWQGGRMKSISVQVKKRILILRKRRRIPRTTHLPSKLPIQSTRNHDDHTEWTV